MTDLAPLLERALTRRHDLLAQLAHEDTDCVRLFHGIAEGRPGLTVDRYGPTLLVQTQAHREPLTDDELAAIRAVLGRVGGEPLALVWNVRGARRDEQPPFDVTELGARPLEGRELGLRYDARPRHRGQDPLLFLDFRAIRRRVLGREQADGRALRGAAAGKRVLNLFSYTCGIGVAAAVGGAREVWNVDFASSALEVGRDNAARNGVATDAFRTIEADVIPTLRQLADLPVKGRGSRRDFARFAPRTFDLVVLDPPRWAKTPFGAVDVVRDYPSLLKPALACLAPGGVLIATNHVPDVTRESFLATARRTGEKMGRPLGATEMLGPEDDFPSFDGEAPLKVLVAEVP